MILFILWASKRGGASHIVSFHERREMYLFVSFLEGGVFCPLSRSVGGVYAYVVYSCLFVMRASSSWGA
jgi:hypothetical protein